MILPFLIATQISPDWTTPIEPFKITDHLYYVGSRDLGAYLVTSPAGDALINANLPSSPPQIRASVKKLGFKWGDIKILLNGQAHFDHMGGAAEVLRETHAKNEVMAGDVEAVESGGRHDFAFELEHMTPFTPCRVDKVLHNGDNVKLGNVVLTAHLTAGHTRGCTTWSLRDHMPGDPITRSRNIVIVGGWAPLSHYRLADSPGCPASYPHIAEDFFRGFSILHALPCDIFLGAHGVYFNLLPKLQHYKSQGPAAFIDPNGYQAAVSDAESNVRQMFNDQRRH